MERGKCDKMEQIKIDGNWEEEKWPKNGNDIRRIDGGGQ